jgi:hypothetical protein
VEEREREEEKKGERKRGEREDREKEGDGKGEKLTGKEGNRERERREFPPSIYLAVSIRQDEKFSSSLRKAVFFRSGLYSFSPIE